MSKPTTYEAPVNTAASASPNAFQSWMGQWRLATLDLEGCLFVLRYVLGAFRSRRPSDSFWEFIEEFFDGDNVSADSEAQGRSCKELLDLATKLGAEQAGALLSFLCQRYSSTEDRLFWSTITDALQLYSAAPSSFETRIRYTA